MKTLPWMTLPHSNVRTPLYWVHTSANTPTAAMSELARDLIVKSTQIEVLIMELPGVGISEEEQQGRLRSLQQQLKEAEEERVRAVEEKERARERLESVVVKLRRV